MAYSLRRLPEDCNIPEAFSQHLLQEIYPRALMEQILTTSQSWEIRQRLLNMLVTLSFVITMNWYPHRSQADVLDLMAQGACFVWPTPDLKVAGAGAIAGRRAQLGAEPLRLLFRQACVPLATPETKGAFRLGYRVMAMDGTWQNVPNTQANAEAFGRFQTGKYQSPFPQLRAVLLIECATHAIVDADLGGCRKAEREGAKTLVRSLTPQMLLTLDTGYFGADGWLEIQQKGTAAILGRMPAHALKNPHQILSDGSTLATMSCKRNGQREKLTVRIISYQITDSRIAKPETVYRLATTLLDPQTAPAEELIELYHERWEVEITIDEIKTHQHLRARTLRSLTPDGIRQEVYGWFLAHYALRSLMHQSALQANLDPDRLSFTHALSVVCASLQDFGMIAEHDRLKRLQRLLNDLRKGLLGPRRLRFNPRVVRQRFSKFARKQDTHGPGPHLKGMTFLEVVRLI